MLLARPFFVFIYECVKEALRLVESHKPSALNGEARPEASDG